MSLPTVPAYVWPRIMHTHIAAFLRSARTVFDLRARERARAKGRDLKHGEKRREEVTEIFWRALSEEIGACGDDRSSQPGGTLS